MSNYTTLSTKYYFILTSPLQEFDLIVIGSGSGLGVANAAAQHELRVAIIEKDRMGGTCLNRGCIPSKLLIHSADVVEIIKRAHLFGISVDKFYIDYQRIVESVNSTVDSDSENISNAFHHLENPRLFLKNCKFVGEKTISLRDEHDENNNNNETITAEKILIASGTRPRIPRIDGLDGSGYITSDEALRLKKQPRTLTIIGGGYIACELAHFFGTLGTRINIIQHRDLLIPNEDEEVSRKFTEIFSKKYTIHLGYETESVSKNKDEFHVTAKKSVSGESTEVVSDQLLIASGRVPNSDTLDLEKTGVRVNMNGFIITDNYLETNVKGIFALGDAIGRYLFKHSANHEAQYAFNNILYPDQKLPVNYAAMPHAIFSSPQVAGAGFTEQEVKKYVSIDYQKSVYPYIDTAMGRAIDDRDGFVKLLVNKKDRKILGCHIIGNNASSLIHEVLVAMRCGEGTIDTIINTVHIHPALSEVVSRAASEIGR
jgi:mycothione reductase